MGHSDTRNLDLLRLTGVQLQTLLERRELTSVDLVAQTLQQIDRHNEKGLGLRAMISVAPRQLLLDRAAMLDKEREDGNRRGPLHGLPIIVKVVNHSGEQEILLKLIRIASIPDQRLGSGRRWAA
jgi:Asp-tRNA(Asn)/Glu-tRNA(Gln) amidotransferase A subunit family amidase